MVQAMEKLNERSTLPRGTGITITKVSSEHDNEARRFTVKWTTAGLAKVLIFFVRLTVTYDNGRPATTSEIVAQNRRSIELFISEIPGFFRVVTFSVTVTAVLLSLNPLKIEQVTAQQNGQITY
jgi:hypothetical protein